MKLNIVFFYNSFKLKKDISFCEIAEPNKNEDNFDSIIDLINNISHDSSYKDRDWIKDIINKAYYKTNSLLEIKKLICLSIDLYRSNKIDNIMLTDLILNMVNTKEDKIKISNILEELDISFESINIKLKEMYG